MAETKKTTTAKATTTKTTAAKKPATRTAASANPIAIFIDLDNTGASVTNVQEIVSILKNKGTIAFGKLYGYTDERSAQFAETVLENKFETAGKQRMKSGEESIIDLRLVMDVTTITVKDKIKTVFVWAGVGDLTPLFAQLKELGLKIVTVDIPAFDCKNKFVDEAIKLFSTHKMPGVTPVATRNLGGTLAAVDIANAPVLPRMSGAPDLGEDAIVGQDPLADDDVPMGQEEYHAYLVKLALEVLDGASATNDSETPTDDSTAGEDFADMGDDFGALNKR